MRSLSGLSLGCIMVLSVSFPHTAEAVIVCATLKALSSGPGGVCTGPDLCNSVGQQNLLGAWKDQANFGFAGVPTTVPKQLSSCKTVPSQQPGGWCDYIVCGHTPFIPRPNLSTAGKPLRSPCAQPGDPCHQKSSTVGAPGLLEGDSGIAKQGPASAGSMMGGPYRGR